MHRWAACPGSVRLSAGIKGVDSVYAQEGTVAHALAEACDSCGIHPYLYLGAKRTADGLRFFEVTEEMVDAVELYCQAGRDVTDKAAGDVVYHEHKFDLSAIHPGCFGTADRVIWKPSIRTLYVDDFKYGAGIPVDVKSSPQNRYYALGAYVTLKLPALKIVLRIIQPRCPHPDGPVRSHEIDAVELLEFQHDLIAAAKATENPDAPLVPGDHCRFCPAAATCPVLHARAQRAAASAFAPDAPYEPKSLADALALAPIVEAWAKSVREFAYAQAEAGAAIPGWKLVAKRATRQWRDVAAAELRLKEIGLGETVMYPIPELKSPAQIEKVLGKKDFAAVEADLVAKVSSGHTLAPDSDNRPVVKQDAAAAFAGA